MYVYIHILIYVYNVCTFYFLSKTFISLVAFYCERRLTGSLKWNLVYRDRMKHRSFVGICKSNFPQGSKKVFAEDLKEIRYIRCSLRLPRFICSVFPFLSFFPYDFYCDPDAFGPDLNDQ